MYILPLVLLLALVYFSEMMNYVIGSAGPKFSPALSKELINGLLSAPISVQIVNLFSVYFLSVNCSSNNLQELCLSAWALWNNYIAEKDASLYMHL